jgi:hypothetical protein|tara:strand:+ start:99 stop:206 length:108 start_codon:yes stop_codon:yes gene_type:complete
MENKLTWFCDQDYIGCDFDVLRRSLINRTEFEPID